MRKHSMRRMPRWSHSTQKQGRSLPWSARVIILMSRMMEISMSHLQRDSRVRHSSHSFTERDSKKDSLPIQYSLMYRHSSPLAVTPKETLFRVPKHQHATCRKIMTTSIVAQHQYATLLPNRSTYLRSKCSILSDLIMRSILRNDWGSLHW